MSDEDSGHSMAGDGLTPEQHASAIRRYGKMAQNLNCSFEQIKSIVANPSQLDLYEAEATKRNKLPNTKLEELRLRKLNFLRRCLYEYIQRAQYHLHVDINEELIRKKALEFRDLMHIDNFVPNKRWIKSFRIEYNISLANRQITMTRQPPSSLNLSDIVSYTRQLDANERGKKPVEPEDSATTGKNVPSTEVIKIEDDEDDHTEVIKIKDGGHDQVTAPPKIESSEEVWYTVQFLDEHKDTATEQKKPESTDELTIENNGAALMHLEALMDYAKEKNNQSAQMELQQLVQIFKEIENS